MKNQSAWNRFWTADEKADEWIFERVPVLRGVFARMKINLRRTLARFAIAGAVILASRIFLTVIAKFDEGQGYLVCGIVQALVLVLMVSLVVWVVWGVFSKPKEDYEQA